LKKSSFWIFRYFSKSNSFRISDNFSKDSNPLRSGLNFINALRTAFTHVDPKSTKRHSSCWSFLRFWDLHAQKLFVEWWWNWHLQLNRMHTGFVKRTIKDIMKMIRRIRNVKKAQQTFFLEQSSINFWNVIFEDKQQHTIKYLRV